MVKWILEGTSNSLEEMPENAMPIEIDGKIIEELCEACGDFIFEDDEYFSDEDGNYFCQECYEELLEEDDMEEEYDFSEAKRFNEEE